MLNLGYAIDIWYSEKSFDSNRILIEVSQWLLIMVLIACVVYSQKTGKLTVIKFVLLVITVLYTIPFFNDKPSLPSWVYD